MLFDKSLNSLSRNEVERRMEAKPREADGFSYLQSPNAILRLTDSDNSDILNAVDSFNFRNQVFRKNLVSST